MTQKAFKYRFYPTPEQENLLRRTMGCARLVYNRALALRTEAWCEKQEQVGYKETSGMLNAWKKEEELQFLKGVSSVPCSQSASRNNRCQKRFSPQANNSTGT